MAQTSDPEFQLHQPIDNTSNDSRNCSANNTTFTTRNYAPHVRFPSYRHLSTRPPAVSTIGLNAFESLPIFNELVSSMTRRVDYVRIEHAVRQGKKMSHCSRRLQTFLGIVLDAGFNWAWSDTCCIDKSGHSVFQESLVAMFKWYQGSAMVVVFLRGVRSSPQLGALVKSIQNTGAWTLQEYVAAKVIRFYNEDCSLSYGVAEPQRWSKPRGVSAEKLRQASTWQTTMVGRCVLTARHFLAYWFAYVAEERDH